MRQPTFFAQAWPRLDHQVYCSGFAFSVRNTSTKPRSSNTFVSQARSSGRKPEFLRLARQFFRSISWCARFQSPHRITSRPLFFSFLSCGREASRNLNFEDFRCGAAEPEGRDSHTTE